MTLFPNKEQYPKLIQYIEDNDTIVVFRHVNPDGDAYGSQWGLVQYLRDTYPHKKVYGVGHSGGSTAHLFPQPNQISDEIIAGSLAIITDTSNRERIDDERYQLAQTIIKIDHHPEVDAYGHFNIVNSNKSSASEMISEFVRFHNDEKPVSINTATYLITGMKTDTLSFSTHSVTWTTFDQAAYLMRSGAINMSQLSDEILSVDDNVFEYVTYLRSHRQTDLDKKLVYVYVEEDILEKYHITSSQAKEYVNTFKQNKEAKVWAILVAEEDTYNVSLRSRGFTINDIATKYGGGGHPVACAARHLKFEQTQELLKDLKERIIAIENDPSSR